MIQRGAGGLEGVNYESITYEGYAPGGVALLIDVLTDNRNRTSGDVRAVFSKYGGAMAEPGAVGWQFSRKGVIIVDGSAGLEVGMRMRRGTIVVGGPARDFTGLQMKGGTIVLLSGAEIRTGAWMKRGTIISLKPLPMMPTFAYAADGHPTILALFSQYVRQFGIRLPTMSEGGCYSMYRGDQSIPGRGEILVWNAN